MRLLLSFLHLLLVGPLLTSCSTSTTATAEQGRGLHRRPRRFSRLGFYESRPDYYRKCPPPYCGGVFVRPIDGRLMICPGATSTEPTVECYVGAMRYPQNSPPPPVMSSDETGGGTTIVYGRIIPGNYTGAPEIYDFILRNGTFAATNRAQQNDVYYRVQRDYRKCAAPLCGGYWLQALATTTTLCADGSVANAESGGCYVANLNLTGLPEPTPEILDGSSVRGYYMENTIYSKTSWPDLKDLYVLQASGSAPCADCDITNSQVCLDDPSDNCTFCGCPTICQSTKILCGGFGGFECPANMGLTCIDDPDDDCDPDCGGAADCPGTCVDLPVSNLDEVCGGISPYKCATGFECVDRKGDQCSAQCTGSNMGFDCSGICIRRVAGAKCDGSNAGSTSMPPCATGFDCVFPLDSTNQECGSTSPTGVCMLSTSSSP